MTLDPLQCKEQITSSIGAMLLLNSSCQALIEASIAPSASPWYPIVDQELGAAEDLVVGWRQNGYRYFQNDIVAQIAACGTAFLRTQSTLDGLFQQLAEHFEPRVQADIVATLTDLNKPVQTMTGALDGYASKLATFDQAMAGPCARMNTTIHQVQAEEADLQNEITAINTTITQLQGQIQADRAAIAEAESQRTTGVLETIFGVLLTPFTGGASLVLVGIGVATLAEAQEKVDALQNTISTDQAAIAGDQHQLTTDQQQLVTLGGLVMSMGVAQNDIAAISSALDALRTTWGVLIGEIHDAATGVAQAESAQDALVAQVWFDSACTAWSAIVPFVEQINGVKPPTPTFVPVGQ